MLNLQVTNLESPRTGAKVANQFIIECNNPWKKTTTFQSYNSKIITIDWDNKEARIYKDYNYSKTTSKYLKQFIFMNYHPIDADVIIGYIKKWVDFEQNGNKFYFITD